MSYCSKVHDLEVGLVIELHLLTFDSYRFVKRQYGSTTISTIARLPIILVPKGHPLPSPKLSLHGSTSSTLQEQDFGGGMV
jgi:hypothetical protein